jgi:hypothetical protein
MRGPIDGGWPEAGDAPQEQPECAHITDAEASALTWSLEIPQGYEAGRDLAALAPGPGDEGFGELEPEDDEGDFAAPVLLQPEDEEVHDPSSDLQVEVHPEDQGALSKSERKSITDSAKGLLKFAEQRLVSLGADVVLPGLGGRLADLAFEVLDVVNSVRALFSDDPVLEVPLPSPVPSLGFTLEIPLASGEDGEAAPPLALCVAPDSPSLTGGWALDAGEHDDQQVQEPPAEVSETPPERFHPQQHPLPLPMAVLRVSDAEPKPRARPRSASTCLVEIDLDSLRLPRGRRHRAQMLAILAYQYAPQLRENSDLRRFDLFIIADKGRRSGVWIWLDAKR